MVNFKINVYKIYKYKYEFMFHPISIKDRIKDYPTVSSILKIHKISILVSVKLHTLNSNFTIKYIGLSSVSSLA